MRSFDLTAQIERLTASGIGRIQRIQDDVYRNIWPKTVELPEKFKGRFDRALIVDAFPLYPMHTAVDHGTRRVTLPVRLLPMPGKDKPTSIAFGRYDEHALMPLSQPPHGELLRYIVFWQAGEHHRGMSPNAMRLRFKSDECALGLNEALHLALQEDEMLKRRRIPLATDVYERGDAYFAHWTEAIPSFSLDIGVFAELNGVPSRARDVIPVSTEDRDFFLKG